jgi:hypothetical protein
MTDTDTDLLLSDEELTELALAADPDAEVPDDAVPFGWSAVDLLPSWYMPVAVAGSSLSPWRRWTIRLLVATFVLINAAGMCSTYGWVVIA